MTIIYRKVSELTSCVQWFDRKKSYLDGLELQLKGMVKAIDIVSKQRAGEA